MKRVILHSLACLLLVVAVIIPVFAASTRITVTVPVRVSSYEFVEDDELNTCLYGIGENVAVANLKRAYDKIKIAVLRPDGEIPLLDSETVGTGCIVREYESDGSTVARECVVIIRGDTNGDGVVSSADALIALKASSGLLEIERPFFCAGDIDRSGALSSAKALKILRYSAGLEPDM